MRNSIAVLLAAFALIDSDAQAVSIAWSPVANPGNAVDSRLGGVSGAVGHNYSIGTYDVTYSQYAEFLNTKDPTGANTLGLWNSGMADAELGLTNFGGITFNSANANGSKYVLIPGQENFPVTSVTWYDAARFANWINNGQGNASTETGSYTLLGGTPTPSNAATITRNTGAGVVLPTSDEWYKAAFYNPSTKTYFNFPTSSNSAPVASAPTGLANHANYNSLVFNLTNVGAYTGTTSPYGAYDMGGEVYQWTETLVGTDRFARGSPFNGDSDLMVYNVSGASSAGFPNGEGLNLGFRLANVASVPEPSSLTLAAFGLLALACRLRRR